MQLRCGEDYLQIIDSSDTKTLCSREKEVYTDNFCSNEIIVSYKSASGPPIFGSYNGFKMYFESNVFHSSFSLSISICNRFF